MKIRSTKPLWRKIVAILLAVIIIAVAFCAASVWCSYNLLTVREVKADAGCDATAVFISDLHSNSFGEGNSRLLEKVRESAPDFILMGGDMLNGDDKEHGKLISLVGEMCRIAPVYYAIGNHELDYIEVHGDALISDIEAAGAVILENSYVDLDCGVRLGGMYDYAFALDARNSVDPEKMNAETYEFLCNFIDTDRYTLMVAHRPDSFIFGEASRVWDIDLVMSGHVHGGQVVLPFAGGLWAPDQGYFPEYDRGFFEKDLIDIYITAGLGSNDQALPRMNNLPEVVVVSFD